MKSLKHTAASLTAIVLLGMVGSSHGQLSGQLGILDLTANGGINPATGAAWQAGDSYRFIFASSTGRDATSADIADYNTFIQNAADASPLGLGLATWKALASTETVAANVNTSTDTGSGESFWLLDGESLVADDYADLYGFDTHDSVINVSETGGTPFDGGDFTSVWSGSDGAGNPKTNAGGGVPGWLGNTVENTSGDPPVTATRSLTGLWNFTSGRHWIERFHIDNTQIKGLYGVSEPLKIVDPAAANPFAITVIDYVPGTNMLTLTWTSSPGETFAVKFSGDMSNWDSDLDDGIPADGGDTTTETFDLNDAGIQEDARVYFRVEKQANG